MGSFPDRPPSARSTLGLVVTRVSVSFCLGFRVGLRVRLGWGRRDVAISRRLDWVCSRLRLRSRWSLRVFGMFRRIISPVPQSSPKSIRSAANNRYNTNPTLLTLERDTHIQQDPQQSHNPRPDDHAARAHVHALSKNPCRYLVPSGS